MADHLGGGVAVDPLGAGVPGHDPPVEVQAEHADMGGLDDRCQPGLGPCGLLLLGDVADGGRYQGALAGIEDGQGDLGREGGAVAAAARQFQARGHRPGLGVGGVPGAQGGVPGLDGVRDQDLDRLPGQLGARVPEHPLGVGVHQHDPPAGVHAHRRVRCRLQQPGDDGISDMPHVQTLFVLEKLLNVIMPHSHAATGGSSAPTAENRSDGLSTATSAGSTSRNDHWVVGNRARPNERGSVPHPVKFAWTPIVGHQLVAATASPGDPDLTGYWATRRQRVRPPLDSYNLRLLTTGALRAVLVLGFAGAAGAVRRSAGAGARWSRT